MLVTDTDAALWYPENTQLQSLTVTVTNPVDTSAELLAADTTGTAISASYDAANGTLALTGADSAAHYLQVLKSITYENTSAAPDTTQRTVTFVAYDGISNSGVVTTYVGINARE